MPFSSNRLKDQGLYAAPNVQQVSPDAIVYVQHSTTIKSQYIDENGDVREGEIDFMNFISSISVTKGLNSVPGSASFNVSAPSHINFQIANPLAKSFSTLQEVEIYMKGRFLLGSDREAAYYPVFWGMITSVSESYDSGVHSIAITCQDMMRWLQVTKVATQPAAISPTQAYNPNPASNRDTVEKHTLDQKTGNRSMLTGLDSIYVGISIPGIINDLLKLSTGENFFQAQDIITQTQQVNVATGEDVVQTNIQGLLSINDIVIDEWRKRFDTLGMSLNIFGFLNIKKSIRTNIPDLDEIELNQDAYREIYDDNLKIGSLFPFDTIVNGQRVVPPPPLETVFRNRLDVAQEAVTNQIHMEFFQDLDGFITLKPPFYNLDVRQNVFQVIEDIDIISSNFIEDETQIITRLDVKGVQVEGQGQLNGKGKFGFAIDYEKFLKFGMRTDTIHTNFIDDNDQMTTYASQELSRRNSLALNGSLRIQGRPELKLGYPIYIPSKDAFYYVTGISHSFSFGGSFETDLQVTAGRFKKSDADGYPLKNLAVVVDGSQVEQVDNQGSLTSLSNSDPLVNHIDEFDPFAIFGSSQADQQDSLQDERPQYRDKSFDAILRKQGSFRLIRNRAIENPTSIEYNITDDEGYTLVGSPFGYARSLELNDQYELVAKTSGARVANVAANMTIRKSDFPGFQKRLTLKDLTSSTSPITNDGNKTNKAKTATFMKPKFSGIDTGVLDITPNPNFGNTA